MFHWDIMTQTDGSKYRNLMVSIIPSKLKLMLIIRQITAGSELMKDMVTHDIQIKLGHYTYYAYRLEIENVNKLNLRRSPCQIPANVFEANFHLQGLKTRCLTECFDELVNRIRCNCTQLNAHNSNLSLPDCEYKFKDNMEMENLR